MVPRPAGRSILLGALVVVVLIGAALGSSHTAVAQPDATLHTSASGQLPGWNESAPVTSTVGSSHATAIQQTFTYTQLPDRDGYVTVRLSYDIPSAVTSLTVTLVSPIKDVETAGFSQETTRGFEWTGSTRTPSITYTLPVNDYDQTRGGYRFYDAGNWAIIPTEQWSLNWRSTGGTATVATEHAVSGPGIAGNGIAYLGEYEDYTADADRETIRLVVPHNADLAESPTDILAVLTETSNTLTTGDSDPEVMIIAAPTDAVDWGRYGGVQRGSSDAWVRDSARITSPVNTWIHEYVHTKQAFRADLTPRTIWVVEAHAEYYGALLNHRFGHTEFSDFRTALARGSRSSYSDVVLTDRSSWTGTLADYQKGALAVAGIDYEIRNQTDGEQTFQAVVRAMNAHRGAIDHDTFLGFVEDAGGLPARTVADRYASTARTPDLWDEETHARLFDTEIAAFTYTLRDPPETRYRVTGEYRTTTLSEPVVLVPNETLSVTLTVENTGERTGTYNPTMTVNEKAVTASSGTLDPGETTDVTLAHQFTAVGAYRIRIGSSETNITVRPPATLSVDDLTVSPRTLLAGNNLSISVTIRNTEPVPGYREITITGDNQPIHTERVTLQPDKSKTITLTVRPTTAGPFTITAGTHTATASVTTPAPQIDQPGFGIALTVVALIVLSLLLRRTGS